MVYRLRDLRAICRPMGVPVSFNGLSAYPDGEPVKGLLDSPVQLKLADGGIGGVTTQIPELRLPCNAFNPMPDRNDMIQITDPETGTSTAYTVNSPTAEDDGALLCYELFEETQ